MGPVETYRWGRAAMLRHLGGADPNVAVAACPGWRARDVVAHVTGIASDFILGRLPKGDLEAWTAEQVAARFDVNFDRVLAEWEQNAPLFLEAMGGRLSVGAPRFAADVVSHSFDVAGALGRPAERNGPAVDAALATFVDMLGTRLDAQNGGQVQVVTSGETLLAGCGQPVVSLRAEPFEALRALSGRRTAEEILAMTWDGDVAEVLGVLSPFPLPESTLGE